MLHFVSNTYPLQKNSFQDQGNNDTKENNIKEFLDNLEVEQIAVEMKSPNRSNQR